MKTQNEKLAQLNRMIMNIVKSGNNSSQNAVRWAKLVSLRSELK